MDNKQRAGATTVAASDRDKLGTDAMVETTSSALIFVGKVVETQKDGFQIYDPVVIFSEVDELQDIRENFRPAYAELQEMLRELDTDEVREFWQRVAVAAKLPAEGIAAKGGAALLYVADVVDFGKETYSRGKALVQRGKNLIASF